MQARAGIGPGIAIVLGVVATLLAGAAGAFGWLWWVWTQTPPDVRARVSKARRAIVIGAGCALVAGFVASVFATVYGLHQAFEATNTVAPSEKARVLAEGISEAMNWTALGMILFLAAGVVAFVAGYRLLRASAESRRKLASDVAVRRRTRGRPS